MIYNILQKKNYIGTGDNEMIDLLNQTFKMPDMFDVQIYTITSDYIARPDLLSITLYGTDNYADYICKINGISNPFDLNEGMVIYVPSIDSIPAFSNEEKKKSNEANKQKRKNEPRKPNEQIVGDSNYIIDKERMVVIY